MTLVEGHGPGVPKTNPASTPASTPAGRPESGAPASGALASTALVPASLPPSAGAAGSSTTDVAGSDAGLHAPAANSVPHTAPTQTLAAIPVPLCPPSPSLRCEGHASGRACVLLTAQPAAGQNFSQG